MQATRDVELSPIPISSEMILARAKLRLREVNFKSFLILELQHVDVLAFTGWTRQIPVAGALQKMPVSLRHGDVHRRFLAGRDEVRTLYFNFRVWPRSECGSPR